tara:strand:- start:67358 stop:67624 length:267 start_codon:yes stop_codon:yes gene_type:complete
MVKENLFSTEKSEERQSLKGFDYIMSETVITNGFNSLYNPEKIVSYYNVSQYYSDFHEIRNNCDVLLFSHIRQYWLKSSGSVADYYSK